MTADLENKAFGRCSRCNHPVKVLGTGDGYEVRQCQGVTCGGSFALVDLGNGERHKLALASTMAKTQGLRQLKDIFDVEVPRFLADRKIELTDREEAEKARRAHEEREARRPKAHRCANALCPKYWEIVTGKYCRECGRPLEETAREQFLGCGARRCGEKGKPVDPSLGFHCAACGGRVSPVPLLVPSVLPPETVPARAESPAAPDPVGTTRKAPRAPAAYKTTPKGVRTDYQNLD